MKKLSIIVPVYNVEKYLKVCLDSLVNQTYQNKEIILVDDGATDSSGLICDSYCEKYGFIRVIHKKNGGVQSARNIGLDDAQGDYIALADSDDAVDHDCYEVLIDALEKTGADVAGCAYKKEYKENFSLISKHQTIPEPIIISGKDKSLQSLIIGKLYGYMWDKVFTRAAIGECRFRSDVAITDDLMFSWQTFISGVNKSCYVDLPMYHYRYLFSSITKASNINRQIMALKAWDEIIAYSHEHFYENCYESLACSYIQYNLLICERMVSWKCPDEKVIHKVRNNIVRQKKYFTSLRHTNRWKANALMRSWCCFKAMVLLENNLKRTYIKIRNNK